MRVLPYDGLLRRLVTSATDPELQYLVELTEYNGNGRCTCMGFATKFQPTLEKYAAEYSDWTEDQWRCKHIKFLRKVVGSELLNQVITLRNEEEKIRQSPVGKNTAKEAVSPAAEPERIDAEEDGGVSEAEGSLPGKESKLHGVPDREAEPGTE